MAVVCPINNPLFQRLSHEHWSPQLDDYMKRTEGMEVIARYFILDAALSSQFPISLDQAIQAWNHQLSAAQKVHEIIQSDPDPPPKVFQGLRFALAMLRHLLFRDTDQMVCGYNVGALNFIVALVRTNQCLCASYTLYVQALCHHFGYDDVISTCSVPGHIFNIAHDEDTLIGLDAGYEKNYAIYVSVKQHLGWSWDEVKQMIHWHPQQMKLDTWDEDCEPPPTVRGSDPIATTLFRQARRKQTSVHTMRNLLILSKLYPHYPFLREITQWYMVQEKVSQLLLEPRASKRMDGPQLGQELKQLDTCVGGDAELQRFWTPLGLDSLLIRIMSTFFPQEMTQISLEKPFPSHLLWISRTHALLMQDLQKWKRKEQQLSRIDISNYAKTHGYQRLDEVNERNNTSRIKRWEVQMVPLDDAPFMAIPPGMAAIICAPQSFEWKKTSPFRVHSIPQFPPNTMLLYGIFGKLNEQVPLSNFWKQPVPTLLPGLPWDVMGGATCIIEFILSHIFPRDVLHGKWMSRLGQYLMDTGMIQTEGQYIAQPFFSSVKLIRTEADQRQSEDEYRVITSSSLLTYSFPENSSFSYNPNEWKLTNQAEGFPNDYVPITQFPKGYVLVLQRDYKYDNPTLPNTELFEPV